MGDYDDAAPETLKMVPIIFMQLLPV